MFVSAVTKEEAAQLAAELERRHKTAKDLVVEAYEFAAVAHPETGMPAIALPDGTGFGSSLIYNWSPTALSQTMTKLNIPLEYAKRIQTQHPDLFNTTTNTLAEAKGNDAWLLRTLDGRVRANLSDRYKVLDNYDLFFSSFKTANEVGAEISRADLSDDRFEMRFIVPDWREDIDYKGRGGHKWYGGGESQFVPGAYISNSETGRGGLTVRPFLLDRVCSNGMILETTLRTIHLGGQQDIGYLSREAAEADSKAIWLRVRDLIKAVFDKEKFRGIVDRFKATGLLQLEDPQAAVLAIVKDYGFTDEDRQAILNELISPSNDRDPGRTVFGLLSAITQRAQAYDDPERRSDMEAAAGQLLLNETKVRQLVTIK